MVELAEKSLKECLGLKKNERLLVITDPPCLETGQAYWKAGKDICEECVLVQISPRGQNGNEPPFPVGEWIKQFDAAVMPASKSLSHTEARRNASASGTRIATLPGITAEMFKRTMNTDWKTLSRRAVRAAEAFNESGIIRAASPAGTDITFKRGDRNFHIDDGAINTKGKFGNLPAGEIYTAPFEGTTEGRLVFDASFPLSGILKEPLELTVEKGAVVRIKEHEYSGEIYGLIDKCGECVRNIAEFGIGMLDSAIVSGNTLEDEKVLGTIHVAIGDNVSMGGNVKCPVHLDGVMYKPSIWIDGRLWMKDGVIKEL